MGGGLIAASAAAINRARMRRSVALMASTIQDQERNRKAFEEAITIMKKCWTEPSFSHHGENFSVPPSYTKWNHKQTIAYFQQDKFGRRLDEVIKAWRPRHVFCRQPGASNHDDAQGAAGLPTANSEAASAAVGAANQRPLAQIRGRARNSTA